MTDEHPERPDGDSTTKRCHCGKRSVAGLKRQFNLCPYHWAEYHWGKAWADKCYPPVADAPATADAPAADADVKP